MTSTSDDSSGVLCLDFANSWGDRINTAGVQHRGYEGLVDWSVEAGLLDGDEAAELSEQGLRRPGEAAAALGRALALGDAIHACFARVAAGRTLPQRELAVLNRELTATLPRLQLQSDGPRCRWEWSGAVDALDRMLWPVVRSAAQMLTADSVDRVRECASESCSWLFLDRSRNRRRRWCDMASCGNRAKARRHYARHRGD